VLEPLELGEINSSRYFCRAWATVGKSVCRNLCDSQLFSPLKLQEDKSLPAPSDPTTSTVRAAGMLLVSRDPVMQFLLLRHPKRWDLPKGHCEDGESYRQAAIRETEEETGIPQSSISLDDEFEFEVSYPVTYRSTGSRVFTKVVRYYLGYLDSIPKLDLTEHESFEWFQWSPPHRIQSETIDPLLAAVEEHLQTRKRAQP
jgi:bis(5'-nucleosidyl)-tetraphosphatase